MLYPEHRLHIGSSSGGLTAKPKPKPQAATDDADTTYDTDSSGGADTTGGTDSTTQQTHSKEQSSDQDSNSDSDEESDTESDKRKKKRKAQESGIRASRRPPTFRRISNGLPEDEASGLDTILHADGAKRDSSDDATQRLCEALYASDPTGVCSFLKFMTGAEPDDKEQDPVVDLVTLARSVGLVERFDSEPWYTTKLGQSEPVAASAAAEAPVIDQPQVPAEPTEADEFEQPEINLPTQYFLSETYRDWDPSWTNKEDLEKFLKGKLKAFIHEFDVDSVSWDKLSVQEMTAFYRHQMAEATAAHWKHHQDTSNTDYQQFQTEFDRATHLFSMAEPIPLDDTEAYAAAFAGRAYVPDAEFERRHVENQLKLIYDQILSEESDHLATLSTTELKYELYYRLNYDVRSFVGRDEHEIQLRISDFLKDFTAEAGDTPEGAIDRLQGAFRQPDVLGFLLVMGLSIAFEPVDYALAAVDVIQALSEGDTESAIGNIILGVTPFVSSKLDDLAKPVLNRVNNVFHISGEAAERAHQLRRLGARSSDDIYNDVSRGLGKLADQHQPVTQEGLEIIRQHLNSPYLDEALSDPINVAMLKRLQKSFDEGTPISGADLSFYLHEQEQFQIMQEVLVQNITLREMAESYPLEVIAFDNADNIKQNDLLDVPLSDLPEGVRKEAQYRYAHEKAIDHYQVSRYSLYAPEVISRNPGQFSDRWFEFWDIRRPE